MKRTRNAIATGTVLLGALALLAACSRSPTTAIRQDTLRVGDCSGPATNLAADLAAALPPRTGNFQPDDRWADLAAEVPGGFAGVWFRNPGQIPVLALTRPAEAAEAKAALDGRVPGFPIMSAEVKEARWDSLQLVDWYRYLWSRPSVVGTAIVFGDKQESINRIVFGVPTPADQVVLAGVLMDLGVPCDLVRIVIKQPVVMRP